jgi:hypothetical protein
LCNLISRGFFCPEFCRNMSEPLDHRELISVPCRKCILSVYLIRPSKKKIIGRDWRHSIFPFTVGFFSSLKNPLLHWFCEKKR